MVTSFCVEHVIDDLVMVEVTDRIRSGTIGGVDHDDHIVDVAVVRIPERRVVDTGDRVARNDSTDVHTRGLHLDR